MARHGHFFWNELRTRDLARARDFYARCLDWSFHEQREDYWIAMVDHKPIAGIFLLPDKPEMDAVAETWNAFISVDDIDARIARLKEAGGSVMREPFDVMNVGRIAIVKDALGAEIGLITPVAG
ncbi:MAG: VOC family protein [Methylobacterium mesophilicum]|nr:VOC family protein [Methylobacterium mesophilicum]